MYQTKINNTQQYSDGQGEYVVCKGKLIFIPSSPFEIGKEFQNGVWLRWCIENDSEYELPIIISETEKIKVGDYFVWVDEVNQGIQKAIPMNHCTGKGEIPINLIGEKAVKVLALPEHFSDKHLQAIVDGKMKDGVLVKCGRVYDSYLPVKERGYLEIHLDPQNHITLFPAKQSLEDSIKEHIKNWKKRHDISFLHSSAVTDEEVVEFIKNWVKKNNY